MSLVIDDDLHVGGRLTAGNFTMPANSVKNASVDASDPLAQTKYKPRFLKEHVQARGADVASGTFPLFLARAAGTVTTTFKAAMAIASTGAATVVVTVLKNGVSITGTPITLDSTHVAFQNVSGILSGGSVSAGDFFEVVVVATLGGGNLGEGLIVSLDFHLDPYTT